MRAGSEQRATWGSDWAWCAEAQAGFEKGMPWPKSFPMVRSHRHARPQAIVCLLLHQPPLSCTVQPHTAVRLQSRDVYGLNGFDTVSTLSSCHPPPQSHCTGCGVILVLYLCKLGSIIYPIPHASTRPPCPTALWLCSLHIHSCAVSQPQTCAASQPHSSATSQLHTHANLSPLTQLCEPYLLQPHSCAVSQLSCEEIIQINHASPTQQWSLHVAQAGRVAGREPPSSP